MFAAEYQGGTHVEVLGTQGQNPLAQWKVSGPQKGIQKVYDKALKGYVFVASGGCRLALPRDERAALGLTQPHLLLQLEVGVGVPFSLELGLTDAGGTRRRVILSSSFSELKSTPLHCQVPFAAVPRELWLNLVLPLADLAAVLFRPGGPGGGGGGGGGGGTGAAGGGGGAATAFRSLDSLQLAGTCRLRRIATLRDMPQMLDGPDGPLTDAGHHRLPLGSSPDDAAPSLLASGGLSAQSSDGHIGLQTAPSGGSFTPHPPSEGPAHGSPARHSTPLGRAGAAAAAGSAPGSPHAAGHSQGEPHLPSRLGRAPGAGGNVQSPSPTPPQQQRQQQASEAAGPGSGYETNSSKLPRVNGVMSADDSNGGDMSPFGSRRAASANTVVRYGTPAGAPSGGADAAAAGIGPGSAAPVAAGAANGSSGGSGAPRSPPWPRSVMGKRAQSGPARISTETIAQGLGETSAPHDTPTSPSLAPRAARRYHASNLPPTISEHEAMPPQPPGSGSSGGGAGSGGGGGHSLSTPGCRSPNRSPTRARPPAAAAAPPPSTSGHGTAPASPSLPLLRPLRHDASAAGGGGGSAGAALREPQSPIAGPGGGGSGGAIAQLSSLLMVRGGVDASIDFASAHQSVVLETVPGSPSIMSTLHRVNSLRAHRYGGGGSGGNACGAASGASGDLSSDSDDGGGGASASAAGSPGAGAGVHEPLPVNVPRIRTRVSAAAAAAGGSGGGGGKPTSGAQPGAHSSGTPQARKAQGNGSDAVDTLTRGAKAGAAGGRVSPANTPTKAAGRSTPTGVRDTDVDAAVAATAPAGGSGGDSHRRHHAPVREATFSGFAAVGGAGDGGAAAAADGDAGIHPWDPLLDEEALLAGHMGDVVSYDDWGRVDERPTPPQLLNAHRAFTPPVVPASRSTRPGAGRRGRRRQRGAGTQVLRVGNGSSPGGSAGVVAPAGSEAMLDLVYDPVLNCYYDGATGQYYELKT
ncbi:hypothetical protein GPECTOR_179g246 [Gonium pectorale]|uniref:CFA20 domain-containing protein n=1 Tax=Gonium pectorale TaxID=33097 RepID=A0A150FX86_GONPE|nr:hypothetical protein GPECTOR_179g246 [Gonium pectorale]|eukprot:KXZ42223.1 hypothetical protein GPECTOR_179g246 [Gonium pectorale]